VALLLGSKQQARLVDLPACSASTGLIRKYRKKREGREGPFLVRLLSGNPVAAATTDAATGWPSVPSATGVSMSRFVFASALVILTTLTAAAAPPTHHVMPAPKPTPTPPPVLPSVKPVPKPPVTPQPTPATPSGGNGLRLLDNPTNQDLISAEGKVGPKTKDALQTALSGGLLSDDQRNFLQRALEKNPNLSPAEKAAIASALQNDQDQKRKLQGPGTPGGNGTLPVVTVPVGPSPVVPVGPGGEDPQPTVQTERYLKINNQSGQSMTVFVRYPDQETVYQWTFEAGQQSYLALDNQRIQGSQMFLWAESVSTRWNKHKEEALVLVQTPYQSETLGTFTFTFNP
jgi:hypothetical protein